MGALTLLSARFALGCGYQFGKAHKHAVDSVVVFAAEPTRLRHADDFIFLHATPPSALAIAARARLP